MSGNWKGSRPGGGPQGGGAGPRPLQSASAGGNTPSEDRGRIEDLLRPPPTPLRYFSANDPNAIEPRLLGEDAELVARKLASVPASQLRRFYAEVMALKRRAELAEISDETIRAELMLLRAKAAYTWQRQKGYPGELVAFFSRHAASVRTRHDFLHGFQPHCEAVMAFHKVFGKKEP